MKKEELAELILFWNGRQSKKQVVLKFKSCLPGHDQSGKTRSKWNMLVDDDGEELINLNGSSDNEENIPRVGTSHPDQLSGSKQGLDFLSLMTMSVVYKCFNLGTLKLEVLHQLERLLKPGRYF